MVIIDLDLDNIFFMGRKYTLIIRKCHEIYATHYIQCQTAGKVTLKVVPFPASLSTFISPLRDFIIP